MSHRRFIDVGLKARKIGWLAIAVGVCILSVWPAARTSYAASTAQTIPSAGTSMAERGVPLNLIPYVAAADAIGDVASASANVSLAPSTGQKLLAQRVSRPESALALFQAARAPRTLADKQGLFFKSPVAPLADSVDDKCLEFYQAGAVCTANDVRFGEILGYRTLDDGCLGEGDYTSIEVTFTVQAGPSERYDIGIFLARDGGSALASGGLCLHDFLHPITTTTAYSPSSGVGPYENLEPSAPLDICGDIRDNALISYRAVIIDLLCRDVDGNGLLDLARAVSGTTSHTTPAQTRLARHHTTNQSVTPPPRSRFRWMFRQAISRL